MGDELFALEQLGWRQLAAVVPRHLHRGMAATRRKLELEDAPERRRFFRGGVIETRRALAHAHGRRRAQFEGPIRGVQVVDPHVADRARTEIPEPTPLE